MYFVIPRNRQNTWQFYECTKSALSRTEPAGLPKGLVLVSFHQPFFKRKEPYGIDHSAAMKNHVKESMN